MHNACYNYETHQKAVYCLNISSDNIDFLESVCSLNTYIRIYS